MSSAQYLGTEKSLAQAVADYVKQNPSKYADKYTQTWGAGPWQSYHISNDTLWGAVSNAYQAKAEDLLSSMISAARSATSGAKKAVNGQIDAMNQSAKEASDAAANIGTQASSVKDWASKVGQSAASLTPYAQSMKDYAQQIYGNGQNLVDQGKAILGSWGQFAPLLEKYTGALGQLDPNNQVSLAANDVQKSYQNVQGQNARTLARMGVDPSSGAYQSQKRQWDQALATALAGAKTRARNSGLQDQITQLAQGLNLGGSLAQTGASIAGTGTGAMTQGAGVLGNAAGIVQAQGGLYGSAGSLEQAAGNLYGAQSSAYQNVSSIQNAAGQLAINLQSQVADATKTLVSAYDIAAQYYTTQASGYSGLAGSSGLGKSLFNT